MKFLLVFLLIFVIFLIFLIYKKTIKAKKVNKTILDDDGIEILDLNPKKSNFVDNKIRNEMVSEDTLNLDELFKTMSINIKKDDTDFDFGLVRESKKK